MTNKQGISELVANLQSEFFSLQEAKELVHETINSFEQEEKLQNLIKEFFDTQIDGQNKKAVWLKEKFQNTKRQNSQWETFSELEKQVLRREIQELKEAVVQTRFAFVEINETIRIFADQNRDFKNHILLSDAEDAAKKLLKTKGRILI